jgi:hypothetical protein
MCKESVRYAADLVDTWEDRGMPVTASALIERLEDEGYEDDDISEAVHAVGLRYRRVYVRVTVGAVHV